MIISELLKERFVQNMPRHKNISWEFAEERLSKHPEAAQALRWMEETGGEPDVVCMENGKILFADCSAESPAGRRSLWRKTPAQLSYP